MTTTLIYAPWTDEQVTALNGFQHHGRMHPFTCGAVHSSGRSPILVATPAEWICPDPSCDYTQDWAHSFMAMPAAPVAAPPTGQTGLRDRIADAVVPLLLDTLPKVIARARGYEVADAVLALLPADSEPHRLALSEALDLGTGAPWDAIRERVQELRRIRYENLRRAERAEAEAKRLRAVIARLRQMTDHWEQQLPDVIRTPAVVSAIRAALEAADDPSRLAAETPGPETQGGPRRGDEFEQWLKAQRDEYEVRSSPQWGALDEVLDTYRLHADTGTPLSEHVCEGQAVGDCDCLETPAVAQRKRPPMDPVRILGIACCPTPLTHNWGCGCPTDQAPAVAPPGVQTDEEN